MKAILLVSHGSRSSKPRREINVLLQSLKEKSGFPVVEAAFLEIESPDILTGIQKCVQEGTAEIVVLLNFLHSGRHADDDIPAIIEKARRMYPHVKFRMTKPIGQHDHLVELFLKLLHA